MSRVRDVEYEVVANPTEPSSGMAAPQDGFSELLAFAIDQIGAGNKGRALVEGINVAGLSKDPERLREVYRRNQAAIGELADEIDVRALIAQLTGAEMSESQAAGAAIGFVVGGLAGSAVQRYLQSK